MFGTADTMAIIYRNDSIDSYHNFTSEKTAFELIPSTPNTNYERKTSNFEPEMFFRTITLA